MNPDQDPDQGATGFDDLLRRRRLAAGMTQAELAALAGVGVRTVRDLERGRSSRPHRTTLELLASALTLAGRERSHFIAAGRGQAAAAAQTSAGEPPAVVSWPEVAPRGPGLPAAGELIGRDRDVAEVTGIVTGAAGATPSVVSLVGLAGVGKTGLALAVAQGIADRFPGGGFPGGVAGVAVVGSSAENDVLTAVATVFGAGRAADLAGRLDGLPALLVVDGVERAPGAAAEALRRLTTIAPTLRILATGRHSVGLPGERVWPVAPLEVPPADTPGELTAVEHYPAVALFLARLRQVRREPIGPDEVGALVGLVRRLGGLPLAIELAAGHGRILDLNEMFDRYGDRVLDLAGPPGTRDGVEVTLRDAVAASYRLLGPDERVALRRLSAFRNRWSIELADGLLAEESDRPAGRDPVPLLNRLLALGLLSVRGSGPFRFRLLDVVRDFAAERASANGELPDIRRRHAVVFAGLAARAAAELAGANLTAAVARLDEVTDDLWAALAHAAADDPRTALDLAANLPRWWRFRGRDVAGRQWLRRLLDDPRTVDADPAVRAWAQVGVAQLAAEHGAGPQELPAAQGALREFQRLGDVTGELAARSVLCALWMAVGGYDEARRHSEAVLALATRTARVRDMAVAQNNLTWHEIRVGDLRAARRRLAAVEQLSVQCGEERLRALARANLAEVARLDGRYADAVTLGRQALAVLAGVGDPSHRRRVLGTIGLALAQDGRLKQAAAALTELRAGAESGLPDVSGASAGRAGVGDPVERPDHSSAGDERLAPADDGVCASIEATIALRRGDRYLAAEWFAVAAQAYAGVRDLRDVAEALVGLIAATDEPTGRTAMVDWLAQVCREGGITLLARERAMITSAGAAVPGQRHGAVERSRGADDRR
jgi:predicted ATPase/transcriptional regulator with XRE-family HTH domain